MDDALGNRGGIKPEEDVRKDAAGNDGPGRSGRLGNNTTRGEVAGHAANHYEDTEETGIETARRGLLLPPDTCMGFHLPPSPAARGSLRGLPREQARRSRTYG